MYRLIPVIRLGIEQSLITFEDRRIDGIHRLKKTFLLVQRTTSQNEVRVDLTDPDFVVRFSFELENFASKHGHNAAWFLAVTVSMDSEADVRHVKNPVQPKAKIGRWRIAPRFDWGQPARIWVVGQFEVRRWAGWRVTADSVRVASRCRLSSPKVVCFHAGREGRRSGFQCRR